MLYPFPSNLLSLALTAIRSCRYRCRHRRCRREPYRGCRRRACEPLPVRRMADEAFWRRYGPLFRRIRREHPSFWEELRELAERHREQQYTTHGVRVRDWPDTRNAGVQAGARNRREAAAQVDRRSTPPRPMLRVAATPRREQREEDLAEDREDWNDPPPALPRWQRRREEDEMEEWDDPPPAPRDHSPPAPRDGQRREEGGAEENRLAARAGGPGCWNCGSRAHRYSACPHPRRAFCYGCGAEGVTLRECVRCAEGWRRLGPYHPDHGHARRRE